MPERELGLGRVVCSRAGRDKGQYYVVVRIIDDRFVEVADGLKKKVASPKKKNVRHLVVQDQVAVEVARKLAAGQKVDDAEIRSVLRSWRQSQEAPQEA